MNRLFSASLSELSNFFWGIVIFIVSVVFLTSMALLHEPSAAHSRWVEPMLGSMDARLKSVDSLQVLTIEPSALDDTGGRNIFFVESNIEKTSFHPKLLCAFESAALQNPDYEVFVVMSIESNIVSVPGYLRDIKNLNIVKLDFDRMFHDSPMAKLWKDKSIQNSKYALNNISNSLRLILVHTFGGVYFDSDIILKAKIPDNYQNFIVASDKDIVNNAVLKFSKGHEFVKNALDRMVRANPAYNHTRI